MDSFIASEGIELPGDTMIFCLSCESLCVIIVRVMRSLCCEPTLVSQ